MDFRKILVLYKESNYKLRLYDSKSVYSHNEQSILQRERKRLKTEHDQHYSSLEAVTKQLKLLQANFTLHSRARSINYKTYDCIITIGGDGTFLEAARHAQGKSIIGVNSAPDFSVGRFTAANARTFPKIFSRIISGELKPFYLHQIQGKLLNLNKTIFAVNEFLICHQNPAALSRYIIEIGKLGEVHRSSGIWVSTAAGSSGAMKSAGGKKMRITDDDFQYKPRELYSYRNNIHQLTGGTIKKSQKIKIISLMKEASIYVDGAHERMSFPYGETIVIGHSGSKIKTFIRK